MFVRSENLKDVSRDELFTFLNRNSGLPLYYQLKEHIKDAILRGQYKPNDKLPTEEELCRQFSISRPVVRQAYDELIKEGLVGRKKGSGTYVKQQADKDSLFYDFVSFSFEKNVDDLANNSKIVKIDRIIDKKMNARLNISVQDEVLHVVRIIHHMEYPESMIESYIPCRYFANLEKYIFMSIDKTILDVVETMYGIYIQKANRALTAIKISKEKADFLHCYEGNIAYEIETKYQDGFGRIVVLEYVTYLAQKKKITIDINRK